MIAHLRVHISPSGASLPQLVIEIRLIRGRRKELWNKILAQSDWVVSLSFILPNFLEDYFSELRTLPLYLHFVHSKFFLSFSSTMLHNPSLFKSSESNFTQIRGIFHGYIFLLLFCFLLLLFFSFPLYGRMNSQVP